MKSQNMIYALKNDEIVHTSEVESGLKCECICPACGARLIARKGTKVLHHFFRINTIFWKDFTDFYGLTNISDMGRMLNETGRNEDGIEVYDWAFLIRSLLKMQSKGVGQLEFGASLGVISQNSIERFHITLFGQNLLEHIALDN